MVKRQQPCQDLFGKILCLDFKICVSKEFDFVRDDSLTFYYNEGRLPTPNDKILLIVDGIMLDNVISDNSEDLSSQWLETYYNNTTTVERFKYDNPRYDRNIYPYNSLLQSRGIGDIEVRANYS